MHAWTSAFHHIRLFLATPDLRVLKRVFITALFGRSQHQRGLYGTVLPYSAGVAPSRLTGVRGGEEWENCRWVTPFPNQRRFRAARHDPAMSDGADAWELRTHHQLDLGPNQTEGRRVFL